MSLFLKVHTGNMTQNRFLSCNYFHIFLRLLDVYVHTVLRIVDDSRIWEAWICL